MEYIAQAVALKYVIGSLVPRPLPPFQCCTQKRERAWYQMSRDKRHPYEGWLKGEINRGEYSGWAGSGNSAAKS